MISMFRYRLKSIISDKALIFWTLLFPMLLSIFFNVALREVYEITTVDPQNVGVVAFNNTEAASFIETLESDHDLIRATTFTAKEDALVSLEDESIDMIIEYDTDFNLTIRSDSTMVSVLNRVFNTYNSKQLLIKEALETNPQNVTPEFIDRLVNTESFIENNADRSAGDLFVIHFYTTIAMLCIYSANWGEKSAWHLQANFSALGIRSNVSPTSKLKLVLTDLGAVFLIFMGEYLIHTAFLHFVLDVPFGSNIALFLGFGLAGGLLSISFGYALTLLFTGKSTKGSYIISGLGVFSSFLSGMMSVEIKSMIETYAPYIAYMNPATLITDSLRYLIIPDYQSRVLLNIFIMLGISALFALLSYRKLKAVSYDHI